MRPSPLEGGLFKWSWFRTVPAPPEGPAHRVRYWDLAAAVDGDYTCGVLMRRCEDGAYYVEDVRRGRWPPGQRDGIIVRTAEIDVRDVQIVLEQEPGSAGKSVTHYLTKQLAGHAVFFDRPTGSKEVRAQPFASSAASTTWSWSPAIGTGRTSRNWPCSPTAATTTRSMPPAGPSRGWSISR